MKAVYHRPDVSHLSSAPTGYPTAPPQPAGMHPFRRGGFESDRHRLHRKRIVVGALSRAVCGIGVGTFSRAVCGIDVSALDGVGIGVIGHAVVPFSDLSISDLAGVSALSVSAVGLVPRQAGDSPEHRVRADR